MTVTEVRDRLDDRFRLLVGSRRGLERHQTLRHAVQWSYELLDDAEKALLNRCSVFAGGFDLAAACAVSGADDEFAALDLLDALVRKSLLVADRSAGRTRFSMLETIRQFAEEQLVASGEADEMRAAHARYFAAQEPDVHGPVEQPATAGGIHLVQPRARQSACRLQVGRRPRRSRISRRHRHMCNEPRYLGRAVRTRVVGRGNHRTRMSVEHRRLAQLYVMAFRRYGADLSDDGASHAEAGLLAIDSGRFDAVPFDSPLNWAASTSSRVSRIAGLLCAAR